MGRSSWVRRVEPEDLGSTPVEIRLDRYSPARSREPVRLPPAHDAWARAAGSRCRRLRRRGQHVVVDASRARDIAHWPVRRRTRRAHSRPRAAAVRANAAGRVGPVGLLQPAADGQRQSCNATSDPVMRRCWQGDQCNDTSPVNLSVTGNKKVINR